jgi:hypothetical protein
MKLSRREVVTGLALAGTAPLAFAASQTSPTQEVALSASDRQQAADRTGATPRRANPETLLGSARQLLLHRRRCASTAVPNSSQPSSPAW